MELGLIWAIFGLCFAYLYSVADIFEIKLIAKYAFLIFGIVTVLQLYIDYGTTLILPILFLFVLAISVIILIFDLISLLPLLVKWIQKSFI